MIPAPIAQAPPQIIVHLSAALLATLVGGIILLNRKGTTFHRTLGWTYVVLMTITAVSAIFIRRTQGIPNLAGFTPIHLFIVLTAVSLPRALMRIRRGDVRAHASSMIWLYVGALIIAGALAFMPGRLLNQALSGDALLTDP
ncbi:MAG: DUF2306 domain-containing protein [Parvularculaceae bacterium]|jgi:uncharacterized membrane protein|nr:DUF2306 domain-containing protein [Parvularculaceae bacterium]